MDGDRIEALIAVGTSPEGLTEARRIAAETLGVKNKKSIKNGCAATLSALLQLAGIPMPMTVGAGKLAHRLGGPIDSRRWRTVPVGQQQPGDVGVTFDNTMPPGADHIYLVVRRVDQDAMDIADNQDRVPHRRHASGLGGKTPTDYFLRASTDQPVLLTAMAKTSIDAEFGAGLQATPEAGDISAAGAMPAINPGSVAAIIEKARSSGIAKYNWPGRGVAPIGYTAGMAVAYGQLYARLTAADPYVSAMAAADSGKPATDALSHYAAQYAALGLINSADGADTLRHLFVLMLGLGMRESSGRHCEGRDLSADNQTAETAEAGLFQTSWNIRSASPLLPKLFAAYQGRTDLADIFKVKCSTDEWASHGSGDGAAFQMLTKACPAFAIETAGIGLRVQRRHWGPINKWKAELRLEADQLFQSVQQIVDGGAGV